MEDLSLHILDIAENSIAADATRIEIRVVEDLNNDMLTIEIADNGKGMDEDAARRVLDPFFTTRKTRRVGLGLPLLAQAARESGGDIEIESSPGIGTKVRATFGYSHIDRKPLGDLEETITALIAGNPRIDFVYEHQRGDERIHLDTRELKGKRETQR